MSAEITARITVVGISEDGLDGLSSKARRLIDEAEVLVGGERHLSKVPAGGARALRSRPRRRHGA